MSILSVFLWGLVFGLVVLLLALVRSAYIAGREYFAIRSKFPPPEVTG